MHDADLGGLARRDRGGGAVRWNRAVVLDSKTTCVPAVTAAAIDKLAPEQVVIVGGPDVVYYGATVC